MQIEYHQWHSPSLGHNMELKVYGWHGKPLLVFPAQAGRFYDFENFGMIEAISWFIESGKIKVFAVDSIDSQSWANWHAHPADRARRHEDYDRYITQEVAPFIHQHCGGSPQKVITTGCSMGGYHAGNFFFRHPDIFDGMICLSGLFQLKMFVGEYMDENIYFNSPLAYLPHLNDDWYLSQYRQSQIIICTGQGAWEDEMRADAHTMKAVLDAKDIPAWVDFWGYDVNHDWPWWRKQLPYFLGQIGL
ncbi:MAG: alpha/beta hydrolase-fold protein [Anaerolineales bacterium]